MRVQIPLIFVAAGMAAACDTASSRSKPETGAAVAVAPPMTGVANAYDEASKLKLPETKPQELPGLHNVYRLSGHILSGSEPHGEEAFQYLAAQGVRTILSVDGATPDAATAARYGMRYVHVPVQYKTITPEEMLQIAKTFRELPGPFYVHCFHGKHRGPTAAAIGQIVLDGASREQAIAEMRQWCGTAPKYEGLYEAVATEDIPTAAQTAAYTYDFPAKAPLKGFAAGMVAASRPYDFLDRAQKRGWTPDPEQPDLDLANEARIVADTFHSIQALEETRMRPEDFQTWLAQIEPKATRLSLELKKLPTGGAQAVADSTAAFQDLTQSCDTCHAKYRNN